MHNFNDWRLFCLVAKFGGFNQASRELNIPSVTLSRRIANLEKEIQLSLFVRQGAKLTLTESGERYYHQLHRYFDSLEQKINNVNANFQKIKGSIKLHIPRLLYRTLLEDKINHFMLQYPLIKLNIELKDSHSDELDESIDIAIIFGEPKSQSLVVRNMGQINLVTVASPSFIKKYDAAKDISTLVDLPFIAYQRGSEHHYHQGDKNFTLEPNSKVAVQDISFIKLFLLQNMGFGIIPDYSVEQELATNQLEYLHPKWQLDPLPIHLLYKHRNKIPKTHRLFVDFVLDVVNQRYN
ncbi:LysR family transcriptional regulator [Vibrio sp. SS-MA-C1-2]|uniref:LysR family transcriptional regulator n=1 Tax=Vibrio sp. SS-MA-C1-2 TaxID=2908646 RepID=UPI001F432603|nr:LysR family transcriptional regulator [Vibrio sp. SS-MA-C1-2]UJF16992.1 LysR family transcriptional regulator [Vibrio sp. SS-MA-C1-2]